MLSVTFQKGNWLVFDLQHLQVYILEEPSIKAAWELESYKV